MWCFQRHLKKSRQWINGPLRDWIVPYRSNAWFLLAHVLLALGAINAFIFWKTRGADVLAIAFLALIAGGPMLGMTEFGRGTVRAYRRTRGIIESRGRLERRVQVEYGKKLYCVRAGVRTAADDYGLSRELIPALANKWKPY